MTNINFQNGVQGITLKNINPNGLATSEYGFNNNAIDANSFAQPYLWFNRGNGIPHGQTYVFTTSFNLAAITFTIVINLIGTIVSSDFNITVSAVDEYGQKGTTTTLTDVGTSVFQMYMTTVQGHQLYFNINVNRFSSGVNDDVTISLLPAQQGL